MLTTGHGTMRTTKRKKKEEMGQPFEATQKAANYMTVTASIRNVKLKQYSSCLKA